MTCPVSRYSFLFMRAFNFPQNAAFILLFFHNRIWIKSSTPTTASQKLGYTDDNKSDWSSLFLLILDLLLLVRQGEGVHFVLFVISRRLADFRVTYGGAPHLCLSYITWYLNDVAWVEYTAYFKRLVIALYLWG